MTNKEKVIVLDLLQRGVIQNGDYDHDAILLQTTKKIGAFEVQTIVYDALRLPSVLVYQNGRCVVSDELPEEVERYCNAAMDNANITARPRLNYWFAKLRDDFMRKEEKQYETDGKKACHA